MLLICGIQHVLIQSNEDWRFKLNTDHLISGRCSPKGSLKGGDRIPHNLPIAKLSAYGFGEISLVYMPP